MYVDLNPIRAAMAATPEDSVHTSAYDRIQTLKGEQIDSAAADLAVITVQGDALEGNLGFRFVPQLRPRLLNTATS